MKAIRFHGSAFERQIFESVRSQSSRTQHLQLNMRSHTKNVSNSGHIYNSFYSPENSTIQDCNQSSFSRENNVSMAGHKCDGQYSLKKVHWEAMEKITLSVTFKMVWRSLGTLPNMRTCSTTGRKSEKPAV